jgi:hypothetical protein
VLVNVLTKSAKCLLLWCSRHCTVYGSHSYLIPSSSFLLEKWIVSRSVKFLAFNGTWKFVTTLTRAHLFFLHCDRWIQSTPSHHISQRSNLLWSLPGLSGASVFPTKSFYSFCSVCATCPIHLILLHVITQITFIWAVHQSWGSSFCNLFKAPVTSFHLSPNSFLSTLFLNTLGLLVYPLMWETMFHAQK